ALWLARWLLFRLMFSSAVVKLASGDPSWRSLTALQFHYFTQPLPPWTAWYAQHWPEWFQKLSVLAMFAVEGVAPFLIWGTRRMRFAAAWAIAGFQLILMTTGNYGFFNILTIALCIPLLDDGVLTPRGVAAPAVRVPVARWARNVFAGVLMIASLGYATGSLRRTPAWLRPVANVSSVLAPLHVVNPYGLFAVMTTDRPEIIIEGSRDGQEWKAYEFRDKPGDPLRRPRLIAPHMPRLDWQMWFAALGDVRQNRWFLVLCWRLLQGSPDVRAMLAHDPFGDDPPRYLRANVYMYTFTSAAERKQTGAWWNRTLRGPYVRTLTLKDGQLTVAPETLSQ
ncbi:MAG TPA: lipase maturation factor family protein, partial [Candidatus Krumholzibacteria bacterium]|nr:lipase maturation factor family protein [Candidatus Krumholzibacteria bacterium]